MTDAASELYDLSPHGVLRPEKVVWQFPVGVEPLSQIKSDSLRKFLTKAEDYLQTNQINWSLEPLSATAFGQWLPYYQTKMTENGFRVIANEAWYQERITAGYQVLGLMFYQANRLVASGVMSCDATTKTIHLNFKASDRLDLSGRSNSSIGAVVDYLFLKYAHEHQYSTVTAGRSRNAFGIFNTIGYLDFKLKIGYTPEADLSSSFLNSVPHTPPNAVVFYGQKAGQLQLYQYSQNTPPANLSQIAELRCPIIDINQ